MIKILLTSDWHLGNYFHGFDRYSEHKHFLDWLLDRIANEGPDAILIGGDVFDNSNPSAVTQQLYFDFLAEVTIQNPGLQVVIIAGNHDSAARLEAPRAMFSRHKIFVRGVIRHTVTGEVDYGDLIIPIHSRENMEEKAYVLAVPYLRDGDYERGMGYANGVTHFLQSAIRELNGIKSANEASILLGHLYAKGSEIAENSSERIVVGGSEMVNLGDLNEEVTLLVLGHIHKRQCMGGNPTRRYVGSALPMSFSERGYQHGVELACFDAGKLMNEPQFIKYPLLHPLLSIPSKPASLEEIERQIMNMPSLEDENKPYLEVNVLLDNPHPGVVKAIEEMLLKYHKEVYLCRVHPSYTLCGVDSEEQLVIESAEDLLSRNPLDIIKKGYMKKHGCDMSEELMKLANKAIEAAKTETR
ncbi:MAG: exonuclease SbcCD subunit D [Phocaeicola sp.]